MPRFFWSMRCFLRLYVRNFWSHEKRLPPATLERLLMVLSSLYSARIEERFLSLATDLLLEMTSLSPDYTRNMFEFPLSECKFLVRFWYHFGVFLLAYFYRGFHHMLSVYSYHCRFFFFFFCVISRITRSTLTGVWGAQCSLQCSWRPRWPRQQARSGQIVQRYSQPVWRAKSEPPRPLWNSPRLRLLVQVLFLYSFIHLYNSGVFFSYSDIIVAYGWLLFLYSLWMFVKLPDVKFNTKMNVPTHILLLILKQYSSVLSVKYISV